MGPQISITEVGPRDGLQIARGQMPTEQKIRWIEAMADAGLRSVEVGSFVPPKLVPAMADTAAVVQAVLASRPGLEVVALVPNTKGAERAYAAGVHRVVMPVSVSEGHSRSNTAKGTFEQVEEAARLIAWVSAQSRPMQVEIGCATAFGCSLDGEVPLARLLSVAQALADAGARQILLADTVGHAHPGMIRERVSAVREAVGPRLSRLHLHDTLGLGLANVLAGIGAGITAFDASLAGLGGCPFAPGAAGNICTEDLVLMLSRMGLISGIDLPALLSCREFLSRHLPDEPLRGALGRAGLPGYIAAALR